MPRGDRTGPLGMGPRTGRGAGFCSGFDVPGYMNPTSGAGYGAGYGAGRGFGGGGGGGGGRGFGRGRGMGWGRGAAAYPMAPMAPGWQAYPVPPQAAAPENELDALRADAQNLQQTLGDIQKRIAELEKDK